MSTPRNASRGRQPTEKYIKNSYDPGTVRQIFKWFHPNVSLDSYHIVFSTKGQEAILVPTGRDAMFRCIWGLIRSSESYVINGVLDHMRILTSLHPSRYCSEYGEARTMAPKIDPTKKDGATAHPTNFRSPSDLKRVSVGATGGRLRP